MGYPDNAVTAGEHIVVHRHPHWRRLLGPIAVFVATTVVVSFGSGVLNATHWPALTTEVLYAVLGACWLLVVGWFAVRPFVTWRTHHFVVTDRRVMYRQGVLRRSEIDIPLARISSVEFRDRLRDRLFGTGTLIIESAAADPLEFVDIPRLREVHALLYHEVFDTLGSAGPRD